MSLSVRQIADRFEPVLRDAFLAAVARTHDGVSEEALTNAIRAGRIDDALKLIGIEGDDFPALVAALTAERDSLNRAAVNLFLDAATETALALTFLFDRDADVSLDRLRRELVSTIATESAKAIRESIVRAMRGTIDPGAIAKRIRDTIGLTSAQARSTDTLHNALTEAARRFRLPTTADNARASTATVARPDAILRPEIIRNLSASQRALVRKAIASGNLYSDTVDKIVADQRHALLRHRALAIAGTEATRFANAGQHEAWRQAAGRGAINPSTARRFWVTAGDERVRANHRSVPGMNPKGVPLDKPFNTPLGPTMYPPLEIACRCRVILRQGTPS